MPATVVPLFGPGFKAPTASASVLGLQNMYYRQATDKGPLTITGTPGLRQVCEVQIGGSSYPSRGAIAVNRSGVDYIYSVHNAYVAEIAPDGSYRLLPGSIGSSTGDVYLAWNGTDLVLVDGAYLYYYGSVAAVTRSTAAWVPANPTTVTFLNQRFIVNGGGTGKFYWSDLLAVTGSALNFATAESDTDQLIAICADHGILYLFGSRTVEFWNVAESPYIFAAVTGATIEWGLVSPGSVSKFADGLVALMRNARGEMDVRYIQGYQSKSVADPNVLNELNRLFVSEFAADSSGETTTSVTDGSSTNAVLLLHMEGSNGGTTFTDTSSYGHVPLYTNSSTTSMTQSQFGSTSMHIGSGGLQYETATELVLGDTWTCEWWQRLDSVTTANWISIIGHDGVAAGSGRWFFAVGTGAACVGKPAIWVNGSSVANGSDGQLIANQWQYIAIAVSAGVGSVYVDGVRVMSGVSFGTDAAASAILVGGVGGGGTACTGYMDEVRIVKGEALYSGASIDVPTEPFPDYVLPTVSSSSTSAATSSSGVLQTPANAQGFAYFMDGAPRYELNLGGKSYLFDGVMNNWSTLSTGTAGERHRANKRAGAISQPFVFDYEDGNMYLLDASMYTDDGVTIVRRVQTKHLYHDLNWITVDEFLIDIESGIGLTSGQGDDPQIGLRVSRDGGHTWGTQRWRSMGRIGKYLQRVFWQRLGRARDFAFQLEVSDPVLASINAMAVRVRP